MTEAETRSAYFRDGYLAVERLISREVAFGLLARMKIDFRRQGINLTQLEQAGPLLSRPAIEIYGYHYPMFTTFHWGLTATIDYFRTILL